MRSLIIASLLCSPVLLSAMETPAIAEGSLLEPAETTTQDDATSSWNEFVRGVKSRMAVAVAKEVGLEKMDLERDELEKSSSITYPYKGIIVVREHFDYGSGVFRVDHCKLTFGLKGNEWHYVEGVYKTVASNKRSDVMENYEDLPKAWLKPYARDVFDIKD